MSKAKFKVANLPEKPYPLPRDKNDIARPYPLPGRPTITFFLSTTPEEEIRLHKLVELAIDSLECAAGRRVVSAHFHFANRRMPGRAKG